jgi:raffinose/stachyose/melibiose transport system substrate-binding protein
LQSIVDMKDAGCFQDHPEGASVPAQYQMFANGNAVMTHVGSPETASILAINPNLKFGFFNLPGDTANNAVLPINTSLTVAISASTKNPEAAKALVAFLARAKQSTLFAKVNGGIAPFDATKGILPASLNGVASFFKSGKAMMAPNNAWPNPTLLLSTLAPDIVGLFTGQKTVDSTLADLDAGW